MQTPFTVRDDIAVLDGSLFRPISFDAEVDAAADTETPIITDLESLDRVDTGRDRAPLQEIDGRHYVEVMSLDSLVDAYPTLYPDQYESLKQEALDEVMDDFTTNYMPLDDRLEALVFEVMPYFIDTRDGIDGDLASEQQVIERIEDAVGDEVQQYYDEVDAFFDIDDLETTIERAEQGVSGAAVHGDDLDGRVAPDRFEDWLRTAVKEDALHSEIDRLRESLAERRSFAERNRNQLAALFLVEDQTEITIDDVVIEDIGGGDYRMTLETGEYALRGRDGELYAFPSMEVGVRTDQLDDPRVLNEYKHPFLKYEESDQSICLYNASPPPNTFSAENVIDSLETALNVLYHGYFNDDTHWGYHSLDGDHHASNVPDHIGFEEYRVSEEYVEANDLEVTNDFIQTEGGDSNGTH